MPLPTDDSDLAAARIAVIGGGNMGGALVGGLVHAGHAREAIVVADATESARSRVEREAGVRATADTALALDGAALVLVAVKPDQVSGVVASLPLQTCAPAPALVSVAAGIGTETLARLAGSTVEIYRAMPNTPALVGAGMTGVFAPGGPGRRRALVEHVLGAVGDVVWLTRERDFDALTALSGSGPAYVFALTEAMASAGADLGLDADLAGRLAAGTVAGAGRLLEASDVDAATLRARVTSPGGTTAAALSEFERRGLGAIVREAMSAAAARSRELGTSLGGA